MGMFDNTTQQNGNSLTTNTTSPYGPAGGLLNTALKRATSYYNQGRLNPAMNGTQKLGLNNMLQTALGNQPYVQSALATTHGLANGAGDISSGYQQNIGQSALGPSYAEQNLSGVANGSMIGQNDPNYERLRQRAMENAATEAGMTASGMGRTGSDYHQTAVARQVGDTVAGMDMQRLQEQEARQMAANQQMDSARQAGLGLGLNAYNSASGIQGANQDRRFGAAQAVPGMYDATMGAGQAALGVGDRYYADAQNRQGLGPLSQYLGLANGLGTTMGTSTTSSTGQGPDNSLGGMLGLGLGGLSLLKGVGDSGGLTKLLGGFI